MNKWCSLFVIHVNKVSVYLKENVRNKALLFMHEKGNVTNFIFTY